MRRLGHISKQGSFATLPSARSRIALETMISTKARAVKLADVQLWLLRFLLIQVPWVAPPPPLSVGIFWPTEPGSGHPSDRLCAGSPRSSARRAHAPRACSASVAQAVGLRAAHKVRFARGTARKSRWCEVEHRAIDCASRSPNQRSLN